MGIAQKRVEKTMLDASITAIQIDANSCFQVLLRTVGSDEISIEAQMDGEYSNDLDLTVAEQGNTLLISAGFRPEFKNHNDKLSAHKVVSIALNISIPEWKNVTLFGTNTIVIADGNYTKLHISLADGSCELTNIAKVATVKTQSGNIIVHEKAAQIRAESKYGSVSNNPIPKGLNEYKLNTVTGYIRLNKTE